MGLLSTKQAQKSTPLLIVLPILTIWFHVFCKGRFESAFLKFPLEVSIVAFEPKFSRRYTETLDESLANHFISKTYKVNYQKRGARFEAYNLELL